MRKIFYVAFLLLLSSTVFAQWTTDSTINTTVIAVSGQENIGNSNWYQNNVVSDGDGGVIVTWQDTRSNQAIYAQRVDKNGYLVWNSAGIPIKTLPTNTWSVLNPCITSDGKGGAIIVWQKNSNGMKDSLYAQRVDANGNLKWNSAGVPICENGSTNDYPVMCSDGASGAIIAWSAHIAYDGSIYAQRIDSNGVVQWATNGIAVRTGGTFSAPIPQICDDGTGGAYIAWRDVVNTTKEYVQRISNTGVLQWSSPGVTLNNNSPTMLSYPRICSDGNNGAIIEWDQSLTSYPYVYNIYAQRVNSGGTALWTNGGVQVSSQNGNRANIVSDGSNGVIIAWNDFRTSASALNVYAQRINSSGIVMWTVDGVALSNVGKIYASNSYPSIASDGNGGAIIGWIDTRSGIFNQSLYMDIISSTGVLQWPINGITVSKSSNFGCYNQEVVAAEAGKAIFVWNDSRNSGASNIYAQKIGAAGVLPVELSAFTASVNKNGIELKWMTATETNNYGFEIERSEKADGKSELWNKIGFVEGTGTTNVSKEYSFTDKNLFSGKYLYRLKQIDRDGKFKYSDAVEISNSNTPQKFLLEQNYPNPFNPSTVISFQLSITNHVTLKVYDAIGRETVTLVDETKNAGTHSVTFNASKMANGIYFYKLQAGNSVSIKKMILQK